MIRPLLGVLCATLGITSAATAANAGALPGARVNRVAGTISVWSSDSLKGVATRWGEGFRRRHPGARVAVTAGGSDVAMAGLYTSRADVALLGREPTASEIQAFEWIFRYKPARIGVLTGSLDVPERSPALVVFVHRDNPLAQLTLAQLDAIFSYEHVRGPRAFRTWDELGLDGRWAGWPINLYGPDATSGTGAFFRHEVLADSRKLDWDRMHELTNGAAVLDALERDRFGIAVGQLGFAHPALKPLALAHDDGGPFVEPTRATVASRSYPLVRTVVAMFRRAPDLPADPLVAQFLRYALSAEGQAAAERDGYFALPPADLARETAALDAPVSRKTYAQHLAEEAAAGNPDLLAIAVRATPPDAPAGTIVGSAGERGASVPVELPLRDTAGDVVGALDLVFRSGTPNDRAAQQQRAERVRDELARRILNAANLMDPYPFVFGTPTRTRAQRLVDRAMAAHPELLSLAFHLTLPNSGDNVILGSSFGRIGKKADEDDMKVIASGITVPGIYGGGKRFGVELALHDRGGKTIGALSVGYRYAKGAEADLIRRADRLRDELQHQFDSAEQLVEVEP